MFTGIIEEIGIIKNIIPKGDGLRLTISARLITDDLNIGDSVAVDGICLTVTTIENHVFEVDVSAETIKKTTLKEFIQSRKVNLERAVKMGARMGGHIVTGHIDGIAEIKKISSTGEFAIKVPLDLSKYMVYKGSVAIDGISLTIAALNFDSIDIALIPHTIKITTLGEKTAGDKINVECDIIGKYVEKLLPSLSEHNKSKIDEEFLIKHGYTI